MSKTKRQTFYSDYNDTINLVKKNGAYSIIVDKFEESGIEIEALWEEVFNKFEQQISLSNVLILGFGAGSIMKTFRKKYPLSKITGIEIDPEMIRIANDYFPENMKDVNVIITDAVSYINNLEDKVMYDLIVVDCYLGGTLFTGISNMQFLLKLKKIARRVLFNQVFLPHDKEELKKIEYLRKLDAVHKVKALKLPYNIILEY